MVRALAFLLAFAAFSAQAQFPSQSGILYTHELSGGLYLHTAGAWGVFADIGNAENAFSKRLWIIEITQLHHPKEVKQTIDFGMALFGINSPRPFIYGKQNSFYQINISRGKQFLLAEKARHSGVELGLKLAGGLSLGLLKPYYLNLLYPTDNSGRYEIRTEKYSEQNADKFLDWFSIYGGAGFTQGLLEVKPIPGLHLKGGLNFDWAQNEQSIKALEAGIIADIYYKRIPMMLNQSNQWFFPNLYISLQLGKRW
ncbi:MAG: hypothetical protein RMK52_00045 [Chitinophagales bacterium]|nr:hypothetical protein [Chitinophagales bacterium]MDW8392617.1 hypothetical protein [Chitinophagales bacterium]